MAITLKDDALRGRRVEAFASLSGYSKPEALGRLSLLWDFCVDQEVDVLSDRQIEAFLGVSATVLVDARLAVRGGDGARICGAREEIDKKRRLSDRGRKGAAAKRESQATSQSRVLVAHHKDATSEPVVCNKSARAKSDLVSDSGDLFSPSGASASSETPGDLQQQGAGQKRKRTTRLPADFAPSDGHRDFCRANRLDLAAEFAQFADHHTAKGTTFLDWSAALRTWLRNAVKFGGGRGGNGGATGSTAARQLLEEMEARDRGESR